MKNEQSQNMTKKKPLETLDEEINQTTNLNKLCKFCCLKTELDRTKTLSNLMNLIDLTEIMTYLEMDPEINPDDIACEDCCDKILDIDRFKKQCLTAKNKFNESLSDDNNIGTEDIVAIDYKQDDTKNLIKITNDNGEMLLRKMQKNNFVCEFCGKLFGNRRNLRKHNLNVHLVDFTGDMFYCDLCPISKPTKRLLYKHMKSVHIVKSTPCEICGKVYKTRELWQKHSLIHNDMKKNHVCTYCSNKPRFLCKSALQKHLRASHGAYLGNKYLCDFKNCQASYASEINLNKHKLKIHGYF